MQIFFFKSKSFEETLPMLKTVNAFCLEVLRMFPPAPVVFGRAKKGFMLQSTSGNFLIKRHSLLCGVVYIHIEIQVYFKIPNRFYLNPNFFRAPLIFAQQRRAKINGARKRPIFAQLGARKLIVRVLLRF